MRLLVLLSGLLVSSCAGDPPAVAAAPAPAPVDGRAVYAQCQACHHPDGIGMSGLVPALRGNPHLLEDEAAIRSVLHGYRSTAAPSPMAMTGFAQRLNDHEIAAVLTYIRTSFASASASVINPAQVAAVRAAHPRRAVPWSAQELGR